VQKNSAAPIIFRGVNATEAEKKKEPAKRSRGLYISFRATEEERAMIEKRMAQAGIKSLQSYMLRMATKGEIVHTDLSGVREMVRLLSNATNNINQIARRANETRSVYASDLDEVRRHYDEIWEQAKTILYELAALREG